MSNTLSFKEKEHWKDRISERLDKREAALCELGGFMESIQAKAFKNVLSATGVKNLYSKIEQTWSDQAEIRIAADKSRSDAEKKKDALDQQYEPKLDELEVQRDEIDNQMRTLRKERNKKKELVDEKLLPVLAANEKQIDKLNSQETLTIRKLLAKVRNVPLSDVHDSRYGGYGNSDIEDEVRQLQQAEVEEILATTTEASKSLPYVRKKNTCSIQSGWPLRENKSKNSGRRSLICSVAIKPSCNKMLRNLRQ